MVAHAKSDFLSLMDREIIMKMEGTTAGLGEHSHPRGYSCYLYHKIPSAGPASEDLKCK